MSPQKDEWGTFVSYHVSADGKTDENAGWIYKESNGTAPDNLGEYMGLKWKQWIGGWKMTNKCVSIRAILVIALIFIIVPGICR